MKKKVFFISSDLRVGGSEKVFWLLSQYFDKSLYEVTLVLLDSRNAFFSISLEEVKIIELNSKRASHSFFKLTKLLSQEKPYAVFTTGGHINTLLSCVSLFVSIPVLIGRESSVMHVMSRLNGLKDRFLDLFVPLTYRRMAIGLCQSLEIKESLSNHYRIPQHKLVVIPNPVLPTDIFANQSNKGCRKQLILVGRLAVEKGIVRLLNILKDLPEEYSLTIAGDGPLKDQIFKEVHSLHLGERVNLVGLVSNINELIASHDLMVLSSLTEGFPNVVVESLAVGVPVVAFHVGGIQAILKNDFNGYIIKQNDMEGFKRHIILGCNKQWDHEAIKSDVISRFGVHKIVKQYEALLSS